MAEVLGAAAAATQLASTCIKAVEIIKGIKGGFKSLECYQRQLEEIQNLADAISENPLLQTPGIEAYTHSLLALVHQHSLETMIGRNRFMCSIAYPFKERKLREGFASIESQKSTLLLAIQNAQSEAIYGIKADVQVMNPSQRVDAPSECPRTAPDDTAPGMHFDFETASKIRDITKRIDPDSTLYYRNIAMNNGEQHNGSDHSATEGLAGETHPGIYVGNYAMGNSKQHNGTIYDESNMLRIGGGFYYGNVAVGVDAFQQNGDIVRCGGEKEIENGGKEEIQEGKGVHS